jgi:hypothetical protein
VAGPFLTPSAAVFRYLEALRLPSPAWPQTQESLFDTSPEAYARTTSIVPQNPIRDIIPSPAPGQSLPLGERAAPIVGESSRIASAIADRLYPMTQTQDPPLMFYNTGPSNCILTDPRRPIRSQHLSDKSRRKKTPMSKNGNHRSKRGRAEHRHCSSNAS